MNHSRVINLASKIKKDPFIQYLIENDVGILLFGGAIRRAIQFTPEELDGQQFDIDIMIHSKILSKGDEIYENLATDAHSQMLNRPKNYPPGVLYVSPCEDNYIKNMNSFHHIRVKTESFEFDISRNFGFLDLNADMDVNTLYINLNLDLKNIKIESFLSPSRNKRTEEYINTIAQIIENIHNKKCNLRYPTSNSDDAWRCMVARVNKMWTNGFRPHITNTNIKIILETIKFILISNCTRQHWNYNMKAKDQMCDVIVFAFSVIEQNKEIKKCISPLNPLKHMKTYRYLFRYFNRQFKSSGLEKMLNDYYQKNQKEQNGLLNVGQIDFRSEQREFSRW